jgi:hypothetical protein
MYELWYEGLRDSAIVGRYRSLNELKLAISNLPKKRLNFYYVIDLDRSGTTPIAVTHFSDDAKS